MKQDRRTIRWGTLSGGVGFLTVLAAAAGFAWLIEREFLGIEHLDLTSAAALIGGGLVAGISCGRGEGRWVRGAVAAAELIVVMLLINLIAFDGDLPGLVPCFILVLGSVGAACLIMHEKKGKKRRKYQIKKYRTG